MKCQVITVLLSAATFLSCIPLMVSAEDGGDEQEIFISVDDTKVNLISGNLTIAVTRSWPRVIFWHTVDPFSPTFDIGFPRMLLYNDTNDDGYFDRSEAVWTAYLDSNHVEWNLSSVLLDYDLDLGEHAEFSMTAVAHVYNLSIDEEPVVRDWANVTFWFCISENAHTVPNLVEDYLVRGGLDLFVNMSIEVKNETHLRGVAIEKNLQGGGTTNTFQIREDGPDGPASAVLSARVDETLEGDDFTRPLNVTSFSRQQIDFAKEDGIIQALYSWDSSTTIDENESSEYRTIRSSCYTNGAGLTLHSTLEFVNGTGSCVVGSTIGILEEGFTGRIRDWIKEHTLAFGSLLLIVAVIIVVALHVALSRRRLGREAEPPPNADDENK